MTVRCASGGLDDNARHNNEDCANVELSAAARRARNHHLRPLRIEKFLTATLDVTTWLLAACSALVLPAGPLRATAVVVLLGDVGWAVAEWVGELRARVRLERLPMAQRLLFERASASVRSHPYARRQRARRYLTRWTLTTVPCAALAGYTLSHGWPATLAAAAAVAAAGWPLLSYERVESSTRSAAVDALWRATGRRPTTET